MTLLKAENLAPAQVHDRQAFCWDVTALLAILLAPFFHFLFDRGYGVWHLEVGIVALFFLLLATFVALFIKLNARILRPITFMCVTAVFIYMYVGFKLPDILFDNIEKIFGSSLSLTISAVFYLVPISLLFGLIVDRISVVITFAFGVMMLSNFVLPQNVASAVTIVENSEPAPIVGEDALPPILHLIIDQQIGIDGLPEEIPESESLRNELTSFYMEHGFQLYTGAYSLFPGTMESIPDLLNGALVPSAREFLTRYDGQIGLKTNAWFELLTQRGYDIDVIQSSYLDYCSSPGIAISYCYTYASSDIRDFKELDTTAWQKAKLLFYTFLDNDNEMFARLLRAGWYKIQLAAEKIGLSLPDWLDRAMNTSVISSLEALDVVQTRSNGLRPGKAIFAHILLPHDPFILDRTCHLKTNTDLWMSRSSVLWWYPVPSDPQRRLERYREYFEQVRCLHLRLGELLQSVANLGLHQDATVIVHGDHGSLITSYEPMSGSVDLVSDRDLIDSTSTIFAIRDSNVEPGVVTGTRSIQGLFARLALGRTDVKDENVVYLKPMKDVIAPDQVRVPMADFGAPQ